MTPLESMKQALAALEETLSAHRFSNRPPETIDQAIKKLERVENAVEQAETAIANLRTAIAEVEGQKPVEFLANGARFKTSEFPYGVCINGLPKELSGRWVALVAAEDDCHLALQAPTPHPLKRLSDLGQEIQPEEFAPAVANKERETNKFVSQNSSELADKKPAVAVQPDTIHVFHQEGDTPFICEMLGRFTVAVLGDLEQELTENPCFDKGDGIYKFTVDRFEGQYGFEGRCEIAPGWEFEEVGFTPIGQLFIGGITKENSNG